MTTFSSSDDLRGAQFRDVDLRGARFNDADLSDAVLRGVQVERVEIDSPWLFDGDGFLLVNGVDVLPFVDAELNRRHPGRSERRATDPDGLRTAWTALEVSWAAAVARAEAMPDGTVDVSVDGEWSFAQTLRHLVLATDLWLGQAVLEQEDPFHPLGLRHTEGGLDDPNAGATDAAPPFGEVLEARASRVAMVRELLATATAEQLASTRRNPHDPDHDETVLSCLHTILDEEWEHLRYAVRDLDAIDAEAAGT